MQDLSTTPTRGRAPGIAVGLDRWVVDAVLAAACTLLVLAGSGSWADRSGWGPTTVLLSTVPLAGRRRWPLACFAVQLLGVGLTGPPTQAPPVIMLALAVGGFTAAGVSGRWPRTMAGAGAVAVMLLIHFSSGSGPSVTPLAAVWLLAFAVRSLWQRSQAAEQYVQALRREQKAEKALAVEAERSRIARELHDVLGHNVSVMIIQAGAARHAVGDLPQVAEALREVEAAGRTAMSELRHLLALLGPDAARGPDADDTNDADLAPQPGLTRLDPLLARIRAAGLPVRLTTLGAVRPLEPGLDLAAYRVVQEGLTNALKYAGGAATEVTVAYEPAGLSVTVRDHGAPVPEDARDDSGRGLLGLRERVALYHGRFHAERRDDGGYQIRADFPARTP